MTVPLEVLQSFAETLKKDGTSLEQELREIQEFRAAIENLPDVQGEESAKAIHMLCSVLPPEHAVSFIELAMKPDPIGKGIRSVREAMFDIVQGAGEFLQTTQNALATGRVFEEEGTAAEFSSAMLEENMLRWVLFKRLAEQWKELVRIATQR